MRHAIVLAGDELLVDELSRTTEQQTSTGHVRYYPPNTMEHRTDMLRATIACIHKLVDIESQDSASDWVDEVEVI